MGYSKPSNCKSVLIDNGRKAKREDDAGFRVFTEFYVDKLRFSKPEPS